MKKENYKIRNLTIIFLIVVLHLLSFKVSAQSPEAFSYQAVIRNASGELVRNSQISMRISILQGSADGTSVYEEEYTPTTNNNGLVTLEIGSGGSGSTSASLKGTEVTVAGSGDLSDIDWSAGPYFIKVETDISGGTNYEIAGTSQLLSVPYALHSKTADGISGNLNIRSNSDVNTTLGSGAFNILNTNETLGLHFDANEIQTVGTDLYLNNDNEQATHFNNFMHISTGKKVGIGTDNPLAPLQIMSDTSTILIISSKSVNNPERPGIQFKNNTSQFISGDDASNEIFGFYSKWGNARTYDAKLRVYGKASESWGKYIEITHDGTDAHIATDAGDIEIAPAGETKIKNLTTPVDARDAVTKAYVDKLINKMLESGLIAMDIDGNIYNTIRIGGQVWMAENLKVTHYPNGDPIPVVTDYAEWQKLPASGTPDDAMCYYNNNVNGEADVYGALYTYGAATGDNWNRDNYYYQGVCPEGWHLPSIEDWEILISFLGGRDNAGGKMKEPGSAHWALPNVGAVNTSGFTALPGGGRSGDNNFNEINHFGFWCTGHSESGVAKMYLISNEQESITSGDFLYNTGVSVRCVKE